MENNRKEALDILIGFKRDSNIESLVIRPENEKLNKFKNGFYLSKIFQDEFSLEKNYNSVSNLICAGKKVVENIRKDALEIFIELKKDSNIDSLVIRLENVKLTIYKRVLFE